MTDLSQLIERLEGDAAIDVLKERVRHIDEEGFTPDHDDEHDDRHLIDAALCYVQRHCDARMFHRPPHMDAPARWPWELESWKPKSARRDLVRAASLIIAEIERLDRAALRARQGEKA